MNPRRLEVLRLARGIAVLAGAIQMLIILISIYKARLTAAFPAALVKSRGYKITREGALGIMRAQTEEDGWRAASDERT